MHDIFYFTDVHGMYDLYKAAINYCVKQNPDCTIIFGGDACDRGPYGYQIMKELLDNPRVIYLKGNHEDMFVQAARFICRDYKGVLDEEHIQNYLYMCEIQDYCTQVQLCLYNGGSATLSSWMLNGMSKDFVNRIDKLPITFTFDNLDFCHAGGRPKEFLEVAMLEDANEFIDKDDMMMLLWDRNYLGHGWITDRTCIFGHTPTPYLAAKYYGNDKNLSAAHPCAYNGMLDERFDGRKIDMDTGTIANGRLYVLNCVSMQAQGFLDCDYKDNKKHGHEIKKIEVIQF